MNFDEFLKLVSKIENLPLPAEDAQFKMVPPNRKALLKNNSHDIQSAKQAGVLALFYPNQNHQTTFALILRKTYEGVHSAQVAFPGGQMEAADASLKETAIRETFEEIGVHEHAVEVIKTLTPVYIPPSHFYVQPFLALTKKTPFFVKQEDEVESIIEVSLSHLFDENVVVNQVVNASYGSDVEVPAYKLNDLVVWGATAMMLSEIKDLLKTIYLTK